MNLTSIAWNLMGKVEQAVRPGYIICSILFLTLIGGTLGVVDPSLSPNVANAVWGLLNLSVVICAFSVWRAEKDTMSYAAAEMAKGAMLAGSCVFLHRMYWTLGNWFKPDDGSLPFWAFSIEYRWITVLFVIGIVRGVFRALAPFIRKLLAKQPVQWAVVFEVAIVVMAVLPQLLR